MSRQCETQLASVLAFALAGCAISPPAPGGALRPGTFIQIGPTIASAYGRGHATHRDQSGTVTQLSGNADSYGAGALPFPVSFTVRQALGPFLDFAADVGWLDSGLELRAGPRAEGATFPWVVSAGARSGGAGLIHDPNRGASSRRLRVEAYPRLTSGAASSTRLILSLGVSSGVYLHNLPLPDSYSSGCIDWICNPAVIVLRDETRLEAMVGVNVQVRRFSFVAALAPWFLLRSGETTYQTTGTSDFSQSWGVALVLAPTAGADPIGRVAEWLSGGADDDR